MGYHASGEKDYQEQQLGTLDAQAKELRGEFI